MRKEASASGLPARLRKLMASIAMQAEGFAKVNASIKLNRRTGRLANSIAGSVLTAREGIGIQLRAGGSTRGGGRVPYAGIHEFGGTIKGSPYLRIPLDAALTGAGVDRFPPPLRETGAGLFHLQESNGRLFLFRSDEEDGPPWYVLKRQVKIPARPYLRPAMNKVKRSLPEDLRKLVSVSIMGGV